ncbi:MAG: ATP-binding cassette domain-containing protein [candidate division NC10 bacterium]|nr:ATP-binding cassette domain-containing protein [candidate division NC10 bacterium]
MIQMLHVSKTYDGEIPVLMDINLHLPKGGLLFLTGPTGAGKTTLLRLLYGEDLPTSGQVFVDGRNVARLSRARLLSLRRRIGIIFQDFKLLRERTVSENLALPCRFLGYSSAEEKARIAQALAWVNLTSKSHLTPAHLSGGEQQRVAIARALVHDPLILLADEPTANLDADQAEEMMNLLQQIHLRGTTVLIATHDLALVGGREGCQIRLCGGRIVEERNVSRRD